MMYSRNYRKDGGMPPPQYNGVMFGHTYDEAVPQAKEAEAQSDLGERESAGEAVEANEAEREGGIVSSLMRNLTFEDLLLIGLIIMLLDSGADDLLLVVLAVILLGGGR